MRIAWFTPVEGDDPVVAYSRGVLAALAQLCEPVLCCDRVPERFPPGVPVVNVNLVSEPRGLPDHESFDAAFYVLGNDPQLHAWIFETSRLHPAIVVLRDVTLHPFFLGYYVRHLRRPDLYVTAMAECYGARGLATAHAVLGTRFDPEEARVEGRDLLHYTLTEEALRPARGVVVHSRWHGALVRQVWAGSLCETWLPAHEPTVSSQAVTRREWGLDDTHLTLVTIGPVEPSAHVRDVVEILAADQDLAARVRYVIAGCDPTDPAARELMATVAEHGLGSTVRIVEHVTPEELDALARAADVFVNLRHPHLEGCPTSLMYELPLAKPVVAYSSGSCAEVPDEAIVKVAVRDRTGLHSALRALVESPERRKAIGAAGRRFAAERSFVRYARGLLRFAEQLTPLADANAAAATASNAVAKRIAAHVGETLGTIGANPGSQGMDALFAEVARLLSPPPGQPS